MNIMHCIYTTRSRRNSKVFDCLHLSRLLIFASASTKEKFERTISYSFPSLDLSLPIP